MVEGDLYACRPDWLVKRSGFIHLDESLTIKIHRQSGYFLKSTSSVPIVMVDFQHVQMKDDDILIR